MSDNTTNLQTCVFPSELKEELIYWSQNEKRNIIKEQTKNRNQPYSFLGGGNFGEEIALIMFPESIGSASKGGMAFDNKTIHPETKEIISAREIKFVSLVGTKECRNCNQKAPPFQTCCYYCSKSDFKNNSDSRAGISSSAHIKYKHILNEYIIYVQDCDMDGTKITLKAFKFLTSNIYFSNYIHNQYISGKKKEAVVILYHIVSIGIYLDLSKLWI